MDLFSEEIPIGAEDCSLQDFPPYPSLKNMDLFPIDSICDL